MINSPIDGVVEFAYLVETVDEEVSCTGTQFGFL